MKESHLMAKHWFEIEKHFDFLAGSEQRAMANFVATLDKFATPGSKVEAHLKKQLEESIDAFDTFRTISAVAADMRKQCDVEEAKHE